MKYLFVREVDAVRLGFDTWSEVCDLIGPFPEGTRGVSVAPDGSWSHVVNFNHRIGLILPNGTLAVENDWIVRSSDGSVVCCPPAQFEEYYRPAGDYNDHPPLT